MLRECVTVPPLPKLLERLTVAGFPATVVESLPSSVVVGTIVRIDPHPNADRLQVTSVDIGDGAVRQIVCGAKNIRKGQKVPVALPGTSLPNGITIAPAEIRGVASDGMLCAADELGLGSDHAGILVLPASAKLGVPVGRVLASKANDVAIELEVTPNRPDMFSIRGVGREVAALFAIPFRPAAAHPTVKRGPVGVTVSVSAKKECPLYAVCRIDGVRVGASTPATQERLRAAGMRPVNAIVDLANLVMLETGQPFHAFDTARVNGTLSVRRAAKGETLAALDGATYALAPNDLVIADARAPLVIAGIIGGQGSGVTEKTTSILLEAAVFAPATLRATSRRLGVTSDSAARFTRGVDASVTLSALAEVASRITRVSGGTIAGTTVVGATSAKPHALRCDLPALERLIGTTVPIARVRKGLTALGMTVSGSKTTLLVTPPSWRSDIRIPEDVAEEIARMEGYDRLPQTLPSATLAPATLPDAYAVREKTRDALVVGGAYDTYTHAFYGEKLVANAGLPRERHVRIANPMSAEQSLLRMSALPLLLVAAAREARERESFALFEIGTCFVAAKGPLPEESTMLSVVVVGEDAYRRAKGLLHHAVRTLGMTDRAATSVRASAWGMGEEIAVDGKPAGTLALLSAGRRAAFKLQREAAVVEVDLRAWTLPKPVRFSPTSAYPTIKRDLAFWVDESVHYATIEKVVSRHRPLLRSAELFDVFTKEGRVSYALHLTFGSSSKTLAAEDADAELARVSQDLVHHCAADIRT